MFEKGLVEILVFDIPTNGTVFVSQTIGLYIGITSGQIGIQSIIIILFGENTIGRMQIKCRIQILFIVQPRDKTGRIGEKSFIPTPTGPLGSIGRTGLTITMPIHIYNEYIHRNITQTYFIYNIAHILLGITLKLRVPISKYIKRRQRNLTGYLGEIAKSLFIIMPITHEIHIKSGGILTLSDPIHTPIRISLEHKTQTTVFARFSFIDHSPTNTRK